MGLLKKLFEKKKSTSVHGNKPQAADSKGAYKLIIDNNDPLNLSIVVRRHEIEKPSAFNSMEKLIKYAAESTVKAGKKAKIELTIGGYDSDPRELYEIEDVCNWAKIIFKCTPGLCYFLNNNSRLRFASWMCGPLTKTEINLSDFPARHGAELAVCLLAGATQSENFLLEFGADNSLLENIQNEDLKEVAQYGKPKKILEEYEYKIEEEKISEYKQQYNFQCTNCGCSKLEYDSYFNEYSCDKCGYIHTREAVALQQGDSILFLMQELKPLREKFITRWSEDVDNILDSNRNIDFREINELLIAFQIVCLRLILLKKQIIDSKQWEYFETKLVAAAYPDCPSPNEIARVKKELKHFGKSSISNYGIVYVDMRGIITGKRKKSMKIRGDDKYAAKGFLIAAYLDVETRYKVLMCFSDINLYPEEKEYHDKIFQAKSISEVMQIKEPE